ncbi:MAG: hypothetical protein HY795_04360 [Desulfovibrio sp.]|nr:hypothetical protein [Desulfovibrio sp.]MBI4960405.1 hypothetical protein [Desulfovibrio sp.]
MTKAKSEAQTELELLRSIDGKVDSLGDRLDSVNRRAVVAGGLSGSLAGGIVATAICYLKAKWGL